MKSKKNAFTLIELLAIIVILAIIAVITVPIILNIIENSRMGAATDSAYGYKDAVNKWYVTQLQEDSQFQLADSYTISSDGKLGDNVIPLSGDKPSGGYLNYTNNILTDGCLVIGDYAVTFDGGNAIKTEKGDCSSNVSAKDTCPSSNCYYGIADSKIGEPLDLTKYSKNTYVGLREYFLAHILDDDGTIIRSFVCGIDSKNTTVTGDKSPICIEGGIVESSLDSKPVYESNMSILNEFAQGGCSGDESEYYCDDNLLFTNASISSNGIVYLDNNAWSCQVNGTGNSSCG